MNNERDSGQLISPSVEFLYGLEKFGIKMDLDNISALMEYAGNPHKRLKVIHVAGTNGKGSTCAMIASVLSACGYKVGLYTSPHIVSFTERIRIDGVRVPIERIDHLTDFFRGEITRLRATFFEAVTAVMFKYFAEEKVDYAVIETGLGGRLDATNIVDPMVSVITGIGFDHTEILGNSLEKIAYEKAGIIKAGRPAVVNIDQPSVKRVFSEVGSVRGAKVLFVAEIAAASANTTGIDNSTIRAQIFQTEYDSLKVDLGGKHQVSNALTALSALQVLEKEGVTIPRQAIYDGFAHIRERTGIRGRLDMVSKEPFIILDVAHNPGGINALVESLAPLLDRRKGVVLFAAMKDKDANAMLNSLRERFSHIILTQLQIGRSLGVDDLKKLSNGIKLGTQVFDNSTDALRAAVSHTDNDSFLLITGSHYLAGEVLPVLDKSVMNLESL